MNPIRGRDFKTEDFDQAELDAMQRDDSTSKVLNKVRKDAGYCSEDVAVRGDDKTARELQAEWKDPVHQAWEAAKEEVPKQIFEHGGVHAAEHVLKHGATQLAPKLLPWLTDAGVAAAGGIGLSAAYGLYAGLHHLAEQNEHAEILRATYARDEMKVAMLTHLNVPEGYRKEQIEARPDAGRGNQSGAMKMATPLASQDRALQATMQLHCDQGMNAARDLIESNALGDRSPKAIQLALSIRPGWSERYASDPAFRAGFDSLVWARNQKTDAEYKNAVSALDARDARYEQHHIAFRI